MDCEKYKHKYDSILKYIFASGITAILETVIGLLLITFLQMSDVVANTVSIIIGSIIHYWIVTKKVFDSDVNYKTVLIYIITFAVGVILQDLVLWIVIRLIGNMFNEQLRYVVAKILSLMVSFFAMYKIRKLCYETSNKKIERGV